MPKGRGQAGRAPDGDGDPGFALGLQDRLLHQPSPDEDGDDNEDEGFVFMDTGPSFAR